MSEAQKSTPETVSATAVFTPRQQESAVAIATPIVQQQPTARLLEVISPATLPEGYTFDVTAEGRILTVTVPLGGAKEGQKITVPFPAATSVVKGATGVNASPAGPSAPVGRWKDGLCDCFSLGVCHPVLWNACCFPLIALGQVLHRLKLTWLGREGTPAQTNATFSRLLWITIAFVAVRFAIMQSIPYLSSEESQTAMMYTYDILKLIYGVFIILLVAKARYEVRTRYSIPEQNCRGCEDCCCAFWCNCCTVAQIARHTADYESHPALCCSETGLPPHIAESSYVYASPRGSGQAAMPYNAPSIA